MIDSPANPTVKALHALTTAKGRRATGQFLAEGVRVVGDALAAGQLPQLCLYDADALRATARGKELLHRLVMLGGRREGRIFEAGERAIAAACDTQHPQGVVASFAMPAWPPVSPPMTSSEAPPLLLVCDDIQDPGNLGTMLRTAEGAGVQAVWLTPRCVDLFSPKVVRAAIGAHFRLPAYPEYTWPQIAGGLQEAGVESRHVYAADAEGHTTYDAVDWTAPCALIVSNEAHGLGSEARQFAVNGGGMISVPMLGGTESLNAAMAAAIILFEAARQRRGR